jgi:hypothetical protein
MISKNPSSKILNLPVILYVTHFALILADISFWTLVIAISYVSVEDLTEMIKNVVNI